MLFFTFYIFNSIKVALSYEFVNKNVLFEVLNIATPLEEHLAMLVIFDEFKVGYFKDAISLKLHYIKK